MHFLLLSSPVGLNFPLPGALWLGQDLERLGGGGRESFKITQGVDASLAVVIEGAGLPKQVCAVCPQPLMVGTSAVVESAAGALMVAKPWTLVKDQHSPMVHGKVILCMSPNSKALGQAAPGHAAKPWRAEVGLDDLRRSLST